MLYNLYDRIKIFIFIFLSTSVFAFKQTYYYYAQGLIDIQNKNYKSAIEKFEKIIKYDPEAYSIYPQLIYLYALEKQENKINTFIKEIEKIEIDTTTLLNLANTLWLLGYADLSANIFERVLSISPNDPEIILNLAQIYFSLDEEKAIYYYRKYLEINPKDINANFQLALLEYKRGDIEKAQEYLKNLPENDEILSSLISTNTIPSSTTDYTTLISKYEEYLKIYPNDYKSLGFLFYLLIINQDIEKAEKYVKRVLSIPKNEFLAEYYFLVAVFYEYKKNFKKAIEYINKYISSIEVSEPTPYIKLIYYYYSTKNYKKFKDLLEFVNKKFKVKEDIKILLLYRYLEEKKYNQALDILFELKSSSSSFERLDFYIGMCYEQLGDIENSIKYLKEAVRKNSQDHEAMNYLGYLYAEKNINLDEAEELLNKALELEPNNYAYIDSLAWIYYKKKEYEKSEKLFEQIKNYKDPVIYEHIGDVKKALDKFDEALIYYKKALKLNKKNKNLKNKIAETKSKCKFLHLQK